MSKIEMLRLLITQRLTAAAEEIFAVFGETVAELEEEISRARAESARHRRRAELSAKPRVVVRGGGAIATRGGARREGDSEQEDEEFEEDPTLLHIKEEEEELLQQDTPPITNLDLFQSIETFNQHEMAPELPPQLALSAPPTSSDLDETSGDGQSDAPPADVLDSYVCSICGRVFARRGHWAKHVQGHRKSNSGKSEKSYTCDICGKKLTRFDGYQKHRRVHTGEKPYECAECGRRFSDNSNYKRHIRTHAAQKTTKVQEDA